MPKFKAPIQRLVGANADAQLDFRECQKLGKDVLVVGGSGFVGRHLCNALALRHANVFSLSRRGARLDVNPRFRLNMLDLVHWVEADVSQSSIWRTLAPLVKNATEVYICLPRDAAGADLAQFCIRELAQNGHALKKVILLSRAPFWEARFNEAANEAYRGTEDLLRELFPDEHSIVQPANMFSYEPKEGYGPWRGKFWNTVCKELYRASLVDLSGTSEAYANLNAQVTMGITFMKDTRVSGMFVPPMHVFDVTLVMVAPDMPDLEGGVIRTFNPYALIGALVYNPHAIWGHCTSVGTDISTTMRNIWGKTP